MLHADIDGSNASQFAPDRESVTRSAWQSANLGISLQLLGASDRLGFVELRCANGAIAKHSFLTRRREAQVAKLVAKLPPPFFHVYPHHIGLHVF
jgi:hypothetical protein